MKRDAETRSHLRKIWGIVIVATITDLADLSLLEGIEEEFLGASIPYPRIAGKGKHEALEKIFLASKARDAEQLAERIRHSEKPYL